MGPTRPPPGSLLAGVDGAPPGQVARRFTSRTLTLLSTFQNPDGSWNANTVQTALMLPALRAAGLGTGHPMVAGAVAWLESQRVRDAEGLHFEAFGSPVWCTAANVRALIAAGVSPSDARIVRALDWLIETQSQLEQPEVDNRNPGAPRIGGWAFQPGNDTMVDNDDTGAVLAAYGSVLGAATRDTALDLETGRRVSASRDLGREWLLGMQNPDGGWSAFVHGLPAKRPGPLFSGPVEVSLDDPVGAVRTLLDPPRELGDPSTEDLTGRVLDGLGRIGLTTASRPCGARSSSCAPSSSTTAASGGAGPSTTWPRRRAYFRDSRASALTCPSRGCGAPSGLCSRARTMTGVGARFPTPTAILRSPAAARACRRSPASC